ncbi:MAG: MepB family protein [Parachlamydiaceae bacterium]
MSVAKFIMENKGKMPGILQSLNQIFLIPLALSIQKIIVEPESQEYNAMRFELESQKVMYREGKTTPKKTGQFVTFWKRTHLGPIAPYDIEDAFDRLMIGVKNNEQGGVYIFSKPVLLEKGVLSKGAKGGKRAMRIYSPWDRAENTQAEKTQAWQLPYFCELHSSEIHKFRRLLFA